MKNILYIFEEKSDLRRFLTFIKKVPAKSFRFFLCPITVNTEISDNAEKELKKYGNCKVLPFVERFHRNAFLHRENFIKGLSDFSSGKGENLISLRKYFTHPAGRFSLWWLSLIAEKCTQKRQSYHNLARLITIKNFIKENAIDEIYADISNIALSRSILKNAGTLKTRIRQKPFDNIFVKLAISIVKTMGFIIVFAVRKIIVSVFSVSHSAKKHHNLDSTRFLFVTFFPYADEKQLKENIFRSNYFGPIQTSFERRFPGEISWIGITQSNSGLNIKEIKLARRLNKCGYSIFFPEEIISFYELINVILVYIYTGIKFLTKIAYITRNFILNTIDALSIWDIYRDEWIYSFFGTYLMQGLIYYQVFSRAVMRLKDGAIAIYPSELFHHENALNLAKKHMVKTIGLQHTCVPYLFLNYFNAPEDLREEDPVNAFPLPDYLGTSGRIPQRLLIDSGWPEKRIFNVGAIRYHKLSEYLKKEINWQGRSKQVVVVLSLNDWESRELLTLIERAFRRSSFCKFLIKPHPASRVKNIFNSLNFDFKDKKYKIETSENLDNILISSRAMIVASSSASLEGIACQCPIIIPRLSCMADLNPLSGVKESLATYVLDEKGLLDAVRDVINRDKSPVNFMEYKKFINDYLTISEEEDDYFVRLEKELMAK